MPKKSKDIQLESANGHRSRLKKTTRQRPGATKKPRLRKAAAATIAPPPSDEQIRVRAYFIAEERAKYSVQGDHHADWLEAKRQLFEEAGLPVS